MTALLVSGLSGSGKSTALHALEDIGFFCTDNLPLELLPAWYSISKRDSSHAVAACIDIRSVPELALSAFIDEAHYRFDDIASIFLEASDEILMRRFSLLRRRHPFLPDSPLPEAIRSERHQLESVRGQSNLILDTSNMSPWQLSENIEVFARNSNDKKSNLLVTLISFSYGSGLPQNADIVFDARFLPNPHYDVKLRQQTGKDIDVSQFLEAHISVQDTLQHMQGYCQHIWPLLKKERKQYLSIAIGCSGGKHRSVYLIEQLAAWMSLESMITAHVCHRELDKLNNHALRK
ncbi:MAG: RNase adapter RapZ [Mariprofundales bacterium]